MICLEETTNKGAALSLSRSRFSIIYRSGEHFFCGLRSICGYVDDNREGCRRLIEAEAGAPELESFGKGDNPNAMPAQK
jgi:hypothetical protein